MITQFGWRADVRGFGQEPELNWQDIPAGDDTPAVLPDVSTEGTVDYGTETWNPYVTSPFVYNPLTDFSPTAPPSSGGLLDSLTKIFTTTAGTVANVAVTKAMTDWLGTTRQNPQAPGTLLKAPDGSTFKWNAAGKLEQVSKPLPGWVLPVAIGGGVALLVTLLALTRR